MGLKLMALRSRVDALQTEPARDPKNEVLLEFVQTQSDYHLNLNSYILRILYMNIMITINPKPMIDTEKKKDRSLA